LILGWTHVLRRTAAHFAGKCSASWFGRIFYDEPLHTSSENAPLPGLVAFSTTNRCTLRRKMLRDHRPMDPTGPAPGQSVVRTWSTAPTRSRLNSNGKRPNPAIGPGHRSRSANGAKKTCAADLDSHTLLVYHMPHNKKRENNSAQGKGWIELYGRAPPTGGIRPRLAPAGVFQR